MPIPCMVLLFSFIFNNYPISVYFRTCSSIPPKASKCSNIHNHDGKLMEILWHLCHHALKTTKSNHKIKTALILEFPFVKTICIDRSIFYQIRVPTATFLDCFKISLLSVTATKVGQNNFNGNNWNFSLRWR